MIISVEIVVAAIAQSIAFSYKSFENDSEANKQTLLKVIDEVFTVKDVFQDAHSTFIREDFGNGKMELKIINTKKQY